MGGGGGPKSRNGHIACPCHFITPISSIDLKYNMFSPFMSLTEAAFPIKKKNVCISPSSHILHVLPDVLRYNNYKVYV